MRTSAPISPHFNRTLGIRLVRQHRDGVTVECPLRPALLNSDSVLHGGVTAAVADAAVGIAISRRFGGTQRHTTVELKLNYLLPVAGGKLVARSRLLRVGRRLCVGWVDLFDQRKRLVAVAVVTYMLLDARPPLSQLPSSRRRSAVSGA